MRIFKKNIAILISCLTCSVVLSQTTLKRIARYSINEGVPEPSGLAYDTVNNQLFAVSDSDDIYRLSLTGTVLDRYRFSGDLEGISMYDTPNTLLLALEDTHQLVTYNYITGRSVYHTMDYQSKGDAGNGIEGVTYNPTTGALYFVNEKDPGALIVANSDFEVTEEYEMTTAGDYSAMYYVEETGLLWLGSDSSSALYKCDTQGRVLETIEIKASGGNDLDKLEGIAIDHANQLLYAVTDAGGELYVYEIEDLSLATDLYPTADGVFRIHPIPTDSILNIASSDGQIGLKLKEIEVYDVLGNRVTSISGNKKHIDVSAWHAGMYFLKLITAENKKYIKKISIQ